jgi:oligopeptide/dipeptide ABC transporter ATP-binding protein
LKNPYAVERALRKGHMVGDIILRTEGLKKDFVSESRMFGKKPRRIKALDGVNIEVRQGEILGIVGESGSGKTTLAKTMSGIFRPSEGKVYFKGERIRHLSSKKMKAVRRKIQYVYQNPGASFDPWWVVGRSLEEPLRIHERLPKQEREKRVKVVLKSVGLEEDHIYRYPHEFSGGQQRRLALARALVLRPSLIIFDEPTSGLDVSIQATILKLLKELREDLGLTYIFISHDLEVVRMMSDMIAVMYLGNIVEYGHTKAVFKNPKHPYTKFLLAAVPTIMDQQQEEEILIEGEVPNPTDVPSGCSFWPRCLGASECCVREKPPTRRLEDGRSVACHLV